MFTHKGKILVLSKQYRPLSVELIRPSIKK